ncbi:unnamed protein product [Bursaphelenchus okinawaensis]|uniref:UBC core domain-containing protein n=1 Tax=Bursaphelenchus okinawaensis TaxID=465554 RepID=A0A811K9R5_9BILA|nr:unnamed protein product [Bursaphelenchus okinawaensis]CAG9095346.1 unnamed protein product [Bursaphelenchus okinawaensis]
MMVVKTDKKKETDVRLDAEMLEVCKQRYMAELNWAKKNTLPMFKLITVDEKNRNWSFLFTPDQPPYNNGGFRLSVLLPVNYPFKPPSVNFLTKIMHPCVDEAGNVSIPGFKSEEWKPTLRIRDVLLRTAQLILDLEANRPLRNDLAELLNSNPALFTQKADEYTKKFAEKR